MSQYINFYKLNLKEFFSYRKRPQKHDSPLATEATGSPIEILSKMQINSPLRKQYYLLEHGTADTLYNQAYL